jgi:AcrR family transcriptional regulator
MEKLIFMTEKNPSQTRQSLLTAAFGEVYRKGFQSASMAQILEKTNVTKGALYYHFRDKRSLGLAVLNDLIRAAVDKTFLEPLRNSERPVDSLVQSITQACEGLSDEEIELGCPLNNLALEMSPVDEEFRRVIRDIYDRWRGEIAQALQRGQAAGLVRGDADPDETAAFLVAALAGCRSMAKNTQSRDTLLACARQLCRYLETLKVQRKL